MICFNPGPHVIWCFVNGTTLTHFSFRKRFQVQYHLSEFFIEISLQMVSAQGIMEDMHISKAQHWVVESHLNPTLRQLRGKAFCLTGPPWSRQ